MIYFRNRRVPHGTRGLKLRRRYIEDERWGRVPHGARGLKFLEIGIIRMPEWSRPAWGAWIEIAEHMYLHHLV